MESADQFAHKRIPLKMQPAHGSLDGKAFVALHESYPSHECDPLAILKITKAVMLGEIPAVIFEPCETYDFDRRYFQGLNIDYFHVIFSDVIYVSGTYPTKYAKNYYPLSTDATFYAPISTPSKPAMHRIFFHLIHVSCPANRHSILVPSAHSSGYQEFVAVVANGPSWSVFCCCSARPTYAGA